MPTQSTPRISALVPALLAILVPAFTACASSDQPAQQTVTVSERLAGEFETLGSNASAVHDSIEALRNAVESKGIINREKVAVGDIDAAFKGFKKSVDGVETSKKQLTSSRTSLRSAMEKYIAQWDKDIASYESEDLKKRSQERRDDGQARFVRVTEELDKGGAAVDAYIKRLNDLESALANDLTPNGVSSLDDLLDTAASDSKKLAETAADVAVKVRDYAGTLKANGPGTPAAPAP